MADPLRPSLSDYGRQVVRERESLLRRLVERLTGAPVGAAWGPATTAALHQYLILWPLVVRLQCY